MEQPITLINPKGERRDFGFVEFYGFKQQVANSQSFKFWADVKGLPGWFKHNGETRLNVPVVDRFLEEKGYKVIDNDIFGKHAKVNQK
jgi:hypothetical protein